MEAVIGLVILSIIGYFVVRARNKYTTYVPPKYTPPSSSQSFYPASTYTPVIEENNVTQRISPKKEDVIPAQKISDNTFLMNPQHPFKLSLSGLDQEIADEIKILMETNFNHWDSVVKIMPFFTEHNITCPEIEDYLAKYKPVFNQKVETLKKEDPEWEASNELDREDILEEIYPKAAEELEEQINIDRYLPLFTITPKDITIDDEIIKEYGYEAIKTYFYYKIGSVVQEPAEFNRKGFDLLIGKGLARKGQNIPLPDILQTLRVKDIVEMMPEPKKNYNRKAKAIEDFLSLSNYEEIAKKHIRFREYFQTLPLPDKFSNLDSNQIAENWKYQKAYIDLFLITYYRAAHYSRKIKEASQYDEFEIFNCDFECLSSKKYDGKVYKLSNIPILPRHIGCHCDMEKVN